MKKAFSLAYVACCLIVPPVFGGDEAALPTAEELKKVHWIRKPSVDFLDHLRQSYESQPQRTKEEVALTLSNDDQDANAQILSGLGRLPKSDDEVDWNATFLRLLVADPVTLNPIFQTSLYEMLVNELTFAVMPIGPDWKLDHFGDLQVIESWETSEDLLMDRIVYRDDLSWSDGKPLTAYDVEFSFRVIMDTNIKVPSYRAGADGLRAVKAYDAKTVVYFQKKALATNYTHLAWPILPQHVLTAQLAADPSLKTAPFNQKPVTNGPYKLVEWKPNEELILERREEWYKNAKGQQVRPKPYIQRVHFKVVPDMAGRLHALETGELDEAQLDAMQWTKNTSDSAFTRSAVKVRGDEWVFAFIGWNAQSIPPNPFFSDKRVRLALALAFDHDTLLKSICQGLYQPGAGIFHPSSWMASKQIAPLKRDLVRAQALLAEAGWRDSNGDGVLDKEIDGKKVPFEFSVACPPIGNGPKVAELMETSFRKVGVRCRLQSIDAAKWTAGLSERKFQAYLMAWGTGTDPDTAKNIWTTDAIQEGRNYAGFSDKRVDELFLKGEAELDHAKRAQIYAEIDRIIFEEHPVTILFYQPTLWAFSKSLRGYHYSPRGFYRHSPGFFSVWKKKSAPGGS